MSEQTELTAEQIEQARRQLAAAEQAANQAFGEALAAFLQQHGYQIIAWPTLTQDGRTVAQWGFKRI